MSDAETEADIVFDYRARDASGRRRKGRISAQDHVDATRRLRALGLFPIEVNTLDPGPASKAAVPSAAALVSEAGPQRLKRRQQAEFIARLAKLTGARISLDRALLIMADGEASAIARAAGDLRLHMREGGGLVDGLRDCAQIDDPATLALVRGAEVSGELDAALATAAGILEQRLMVTRRIATGLLYPSLLLVIAVISVGLIMIAIIPQFRPLVEDRMELVPLLGRAIFALSGALTAIWPLILAGLLGLAAAGYWLHRQGRALPLLVGAAGRLPFVRDVFRRNQAMIVLHILGALLKRDVNLSEAIRVVAGTAPDGEVRGALSEISGAVSEGQALSAAFARTGILGSSAVEMLRIGEETGDLPGMAARAAQEMREVSDRTLERFLALFQPAMIVVVGLLVGVSLYALFSAIVSVNQIAF